MKPEVYVIGGPTASGKSKLAVELAKKINGEIISADSMQIYKEMNNCKNNKRRNARNKTLPYRYCIS